MRMGRKFQAFFLVLSTIVPMILSGKASIPSGSCVYTGKWQTNGGVTKLYDTPFGAVYKFPISEYFDFTDLYKDNTGDNVYCLQFDMPVFYKNRKKEYRFVVVDFKIRTFPAVSECANPELVFSFTRSLNSAGSISKYRDLNGISYFETDNEWYGIAAYKRSPYKPKHAKPPESWFLSCGFKYWPYYKPVSCRVIFDTFKGGLVSTNVNGKKNIELHHEVSSIYPLGNSYGICIQHNSKQLPRIPLPRKLLEVSPPKVTLTNDENDLKSLLPVEIVKYPYSSYPEITERINRVKNPDWLYAYAMKLRQGEDLIKAVDVLERAAKKEHIFAMYQLGVCYYRGIGVEADMEKAVKWLRRAAEYSMPEAVALLGLISFRKDKSVYLFEKNRNMLNNSLKIPFPGGATHGNWVMDRMFYHSNSCKVFLRNNICSPKWALWMAIDSFIKPYYKNAVPPGLLPKPEPDADIKPIKIWIPEINRKITAENKPRYKIIVPVNYAKIKMRKKRYPATRFYDIRVEGLGVFGKGKELFEEALEKGYLPALLYAARLQAEVAHDNEQALRLFEAGAKAGSSECALEALHCRARLGKLGIGDFFVDQDIKFADCPLYYMLRYMVRNPNAPGIKEFLAGKYEDAREIWRQEASPWNNFLLGAEALYQYLDYGFDTAAYRIYWGKTDDLSRAFEYLDKAAEANIVPALYLTGKYYFEGIRSKGRLDSGKGRGIELLERADKAGHLKARYLLVKRQFESQNYANNEFMKKLAPLRKADFAEAWLLSTDIYAKLNKYNKNCVNNILNGYKRAARLGCHRAWDRLARLYYSGKIIAEDKKKAAEYWGEFVKLDSEDRNQDFNDIFWSEVETPVIVTYDKYGLPFPKGSSLKTRKMQKYYFERY